jgi:hypothetical protein
VFTNTKRSSITIIKLLPKGPAGMKFAFNGSADLMKSAPAGGVLLGHGQRHTFTRVPTGTHTVREMLQEGWRVNVTCRGVPAEQIAIARDAAGFATGSVNVTIATPGESATCTFINTKPPTDAGTIVLRKLTDPPGGRGFEIVGSLGSFTLDDGGPGEVIERAPGTYTVSEVRMPRGWSFASLSCEDPSGDTTTAGRIATIKLAAKERVICTWVNTRPIVPPKLTGSPECVEWRAGQAVPLRVQVADTDGSVRSVSFTVDGPGERVGPLAGTKQAAPASVEIWSAAWTPAVAGIYTVTATAVDSDGQPATVTFTVRVLPPGERCQSGPGGGCFDGTRPLPPLRVTVQHPPEAVRRVVFHIRRLPGGPEQTQAARAEGNGVYTAEWPTLAAGATYEVFARVHLTGRRTAQDAPIGHFEIAPEGRRCEPGGGQPGMGRLVLRKRTRPENSPQPFAFTSTINIPGLDLSAFTMSAAEGRDVRVPAGTYTITESAAPSPWQLVEVRCPGATHSLVGAGVEVQVEAGKTATCEWINERGPRVRVTKRFEQVANPTKELAVQVTARDAGGRVLVADGLLHNQSLDVPGVQVGQAVQISEAVDDRWVVRIECSGVPAAQIDRRAQAEGIVTVTPRAATDDIACTIFNTARELLKPLLTVTKRVEGVDDPTTIGAFPVSVRNARTGSVLHDEGLAHGQSFTVPGLDLNVLVQIQEVVDVTVGWSVRIACTGVPSTQIDLSQQANGIATVTPRSRLDAIHCTIINTRTRPSGLPRLTIVKQFEGVTDPSAQPAVPFIASDAATGAALRQERLGHGQSFSIENLPLDRGVSVSEEIDGARWTMRIACTGAPAAQFDLTFASAGEVTFTPRSRQDDATCTVTNTPRPPDDGGQPPRIEAVGTPRCVVVRATVPLRATVRAEGGARAVEFVIVRDGQLLARVTGRLLSSDNGVEAWGSFWNPVTAGRYTVTVEVAGQGDPPVRASRRVEIQVQPIGQLCETFTTKNCYEVAAGRSHAIPLTVRTAYPDGVIRSVELRVATLPGGAEAALPLQPTTEGYAVTWRPAPGTYRLILTITFNDGAPPVRIETLPVTVMPPGRPCVPGGGGGDEPGPLNIDGADCVERPNPVRLSVAVTDEQRPLAEVTLWARTGTGLPRRVGSAAGDAREVVWSNPPEGEHELYVTARDRNDALLTSNTHIVRVMPPGGCSVSPTTRLVLRKVTDPLNTTVRFDFTSPQLGDFPMAEGEGIDRAFTPGRYNVSESDRLPPGWYFAGAGCDDTTRDTEINGRSADIRLMQGDTVRCTWTNVTATVPGGCFDATKPPELRVSTAHDATLITRVEFLVKQVQDADGNRVTAAEQTIAGAPDPRTPGDYIAPWKPAPGAYDVRVRLTFRAPTAEAATTAAVRIAVMPRGRLCNAGRIIVAKRTVPAGGTGFEFFGPWTERVVLNDGRSSKAFEVVPGAHEVREGAREGWGLTGISCDGGKQAAEIDVKNRRATAHVGAGETVLCTFTNARGSGGGGGDPEPKPGTIEIIKTVVREDGDPPAPPFRFSGSLGNFPLEDGGRETRTNLAPGTYVVTEATTPPWTFTTIICSDKGNTSVNNAGRTATIGLDPGEKVTCTFINDDGPIEGNIVRIVKLFESAGPANELWADFTSDIPAGDRDLSSFRLTQAHRSEEAKRVPPGVYTVTESGLPEGWELANIECFDNIGNDSEADVASGTAIINLAEFDIVTCFFTNKKEADEPGGDDPGRPRNIIIEKCVGDRCAPADEPAFGFSWSGPTGSGSTPPGKLVSAERWGFDASRDGTYTITEAAKAGWAVTSITCQGATRAMPDTDNRTVRVTVDENVAGNVTCTFVNERDGGATPSATTLTIVKALPAGATEVFTFSSTTLTTQGDFKLPDATKRPPAMSRTFPVQTHTGYSVRESVPDGWVDPPDISCNFDHARWSRTGAALTITELLPDDRDPTCTFTNRRKPADGGGGGGDVPTATMIVGKQAPDDPEQRQPFSISMTGIVSGTLKPDDGRAQFFNGSNSLPVTVRAAAAGANPPVTNTITESLPDGWTLSNARCNDDAELVGEPTVGARSASIKYTIPEGGSGSCTLTNMLVEDEPADELPTVSGQATVKVVAGAAQATPISFTGGDDGAATLSVVSKPALAECDAAKSIQPGKSGTLTCRLKAPIDARGSIGTVNVQLVETSGQRRTAYASTAITATATCRDGVCQLGPQSAGMAALAADTGETCASCPQDCGVCQPEPVDNPPTLSVSPAENARVEVGKSVTYSLSASDDRGVTHLVFDGTSDQVYGGPGEPATPPTSVTRTYTARAPSADDTPMAKTCAAIDTASKRKEVTRTVITEKAPPEPSKPPARPSLDVTVRPTDVYEMQDVACEATVTPNGTSLSASDVVLEVWRESSPRVRLRRVTGASTGFQAERTAITCTGTLGAYDPPVSDSAGVTGKPLAAPTVSLSVSPAGGPYNPGQQVVVKATGTSTQSGITVSSVTINGSAGSNPHQITATLPNAFDAEASFEAYATNSMGVSTPKPYPKVTVRTRGRRPVAVTASCSPSSVASGDLVVCSASRTNLDGAELIGGVAWSGEASGSGDTISFNPDNAGASARSFSLTAKQSYRLTPGGAVEIASAPAGGTVNPSQPTQPTQPPEPMTMTCSGDINKADCSLTDVPTDAAVTWMPSWTAASSGGTSKSWSNVPGGTHSVSASACPNRITIAADNCSSAGASVTVAAPPEPPTAPVYYCSGAPTYKVVSADVCPNDKNCYATSAEVAPNCKAPQPSQPPQQSSSPPQQSSSPPQGSGI